MGVWLAIRRVFGEGGIKEMKSKRERRKRLQ